MTHKVAQEIFSKPQKHKIDVAWHKNIAQQLCDYFACHNILATLVSVMSNGCVSEFVFQSDSYDTICKHVLDMETKLKLECNILAQHSHHQYNKGIFYGIDTYLRNQEGVHAKPVMHIKHQASFVKLQIACPCSVPVAFSEALSMPMFAQANATSLAFPIGRNTNCTFEVAMLQQLPHLLIGGIAGSGKSIFLHTLISALTLKNSPQNLRLMLIDTKYSEFEVYKNAPHSLTKNAINKPNHALNALKLAQSIMQQRQDILALAQKSNIQEYLCSMPNQAQNLYTLVIVIDEFAELMQHDNTLTNELLCDLAQQGRAVGIHLVLSSQRITKQVFTPQLKQHINARLAFAVSTQLESMTLIDTLGAQTLVGRGDMLFCHPSPSQPIRAYGCNITMQEIHRVQDFLKASYATHFDEHIEQQIFCD